MSRHVRLFLLLLLTCQLVQGSAAPSFPREEAPPSSEDGRTKRTLFNIIWGCVSTTFVCTWTALHPNIPPRESLLKRALRRLELMWWAVVAPEIFPSWALNQLLAAKTVRGVYNEGKGYKEESIGIMKRWFYLYELPYDNSRAWTLKHGHFLIMGGFHLVEPVGGDPSTSETIVAGTDFEKRTGLEGATIPATGTLTTEKGTNTDAERGNQVILEEARGRVTILTLEMLRELVKDPDFKIQITEDEITDRSKGNALSKTVFIFQTTWFIIQCIARVIQGLPLTQLELTTLALASLNGITLFLWWDKPLGVQTPVYVYLKRKLTDAERDVIGRAESTRSLFFSALELGRFCFQEIPHYVRDVLLFRSHKKFFVAALRWIIYPLEFVLCIVILVAMVFTMSLYCLMMDIWQTSSSLSIDATHVPTYYVPTHRYSSDFHVLLLVILGSIFGGIHCAGWNFLLPTHVEQQLWRIASLAVTAIPIGVAAIAVVILPKIAVKPLPNSPRFSMWIFEYGEFVFFSIPVVVYGFARLILLGQALALLRNLPPGAFIALEWTKFYPHSS